MKSKKLLFFPLLSTLVLVTSLPVSGKADENLLPLGSAAPGFDLPDVTTGQKISLNVFQEKKLLVVMFLCKHCPYVQNVKKGVAQFANDYAGKEVGIVAISANDASRYKEDSPESLKQMAKEEGFPFPFLYDESQQVAKAYTAIATPDFFLFDQDRKLIYRGQFDESRPDDDKPVTGKDLRDAVDTALSGQPVPSEQVPSVGCSIKWKKGNEPKYV